MESLSAANCDMTDTGKYIDHVPIYCLHVISRGFGKIGSHNLLHFLANFRFA